MTPVTPISTYSSALTEAIAKGGKTTIICGPQARDDVISAIAPHGPFLDVEVVTLDMAITHGAKKLSPRKPLNHTAVASVVAALLSDGAPATAFHTNGLNNEAVTRESLTSSITTLLNLPESWRKPEGNEQLPQVVYELALKAEAQLKDHYFTKPEAVQVTAEALKSRRVIVAGPIGFDSFTTWALEQISPDQTLDLAVESATHTHSFVSEVDEAAFIARTITEKVAHGVPLHAMAVGSCNAETLPFITQALDRAGIAYSAPATAIWLENPYLRAIAMLLRLDPSTMLRTDLVNLLETGKVRGENPGLIVFDIITRNSSESYYSGKDWDRPEPQDLPEKKSAMWKKTTTWVKHLRSRLDVVWSAGTWETAANRLEDVVKEEFAKFYGPEKVMLDEVLSLLSGMSGPVSRSLAVEVVHNLLESAQPKVGEGLLKVGLLEKLAGRNLKVVFICGATDEALPGSITTNPSITAQQLHLTSADFLKQREQAFAAATASAAEVVYTYPRSHADGAGMSKPSLWVEGDTTDHGPAYLDVAAGKLIPLDQEEINTLIAAQKKAEITATKDDDPDQPSADSLYAQISHARRKGVANEYNGFLVADKFTAGKKFFEKDISVSALESFANSPLTFFISRVLGQGVLESPEAQLDVDPRESGTLYHAIFEAWLNRVWLEATDRPDNYADIDWEQAKEILSEITEHYLAQANTGDKSTAVFSRYATSVRNAVEHWFNSEMKDAKEGWTPLGAELGFGYNRHFETHDTPLVVELSNGETMSFTGSIDRFDYRIDKDGTYELRVTDYKSGKKPHDVEQKYPTGGKKKQSGSQEFFRFQLALYGEVVRRSFGDDAIEGLINNIGKKFEGHQVEIYARFWHFMPAAEKEFVSIEVTDDVHNVLVSNLTTIYEMITQGKFPATVQSGFYASDERLRLGYSAYDTVANAFADENIVPLNLTYSAEETAGK